VKITHEQNGAVTIVSVIGRLDAVMAPQLIEYLDAVLSAGHTQLVVSLAGLDYTSSAGLRVLLRTLKAVRDRGGDLRVAAVQQNVKKVFQISGLTDVIQFYADVAAAAASF
jgi:anti-sigma B factor antagonist